MFSNNNWTTNATHTIVTINAQLISANITLVFTAILRTDPTIPLESLISNLATLQYSSLPASMQPDSRFWFSLLTPVAIPSYGPTLAVTFSATRASIGAI